MKKHTKVESTPPYWKEHIPKLPERTEWTRDEHGYPVFYNDGVCISCAGEAKVFSHAWYKFKYQLLGYCEGCVTSRMGVAPTPEQEQAQIEARKKKEIKKFPRYLRPEYSLWTRLQTIASDKKL